MGRLGQVARFSSRGDRNAHVALESPLENRGFALWLTCQGKIKSSKAEKKFGPADRGVGGVAGYEIEVNLKRKVFELWPELNQMDRSSQEAFVSEVYQYLRASGNAICVKQPGLGKGTHGIPTWWLREKWNDVKAVGVFRPTELTSRERRLSAAEAGEDRPPSPVEVKKREARADASRKALADAREKNKVKWAADRKDRIDRILAVLKDAEWPLYADEVTERTGINKSVAERLLREATAEGVIARRLETREERGAQQYGRFHMLYWYETPVPTRPVETYRVTSSALDKIQFGQTLIVERFSPGVKREVLELVEAGMLELFTGEDGVDRVRLPDSERPAVKPAPAKESEPEPAPAPEAPIYTGMEAIGAAIARIVDAEVEKRTGGLDVEALRQQLAEERTARARGDAALIEARAELSERTAERDRLQAQLDGIRKQLGL